ncbi:MAG: lytic transglycosylase domain-containing protein [Pseudomonadota bacterium]
MLNALRAIRFALVATLLGGCLCCLPVAPALAAQEASALSDAMAALRDGDWETARAEARRAGPVARDIIDWHYHRSGRGSFDEIRTFLERRSDWPGLPYLRRKTEGRVPYRARAADVIAHFSRVPPQTGAGTVVLAVAHETAGDAQAARELVVRAWRDYPLTTGDERYLLERYGELLRPHHEARLDMLLWEGREKAATRMLPRVSAGWQALAQARMALRETKQGVDGLIEKVPASLANHPGLAYERFLWRARKGRNESAIDLALTREGTVDALGRPQDWANLRRILARWLMRQGNAERAYKLASAHGLSSGSQFADLEWLSGYLALRYLDNPAAAVQHFQAFGAAVVTPISLGRAGYWEGRALEALGDDVAAMQAYRRGGEHQTSFYGLLAAERAGMPMDPTLTGETSYPDWASAAFASSSVFEAAFLLLQAGEKALSERFLVHLTESLGATEIGQLGDFALSVDEPHMALMIAKRAVYQGVVVPRAYFPVVDLGLGELPVPPELALAIARRESEFDPSVRSGAGALGLMQVMPATAREVAGWINVKYDRARMLSDPVYNARLGVTYLSELRDILGENHALVAAGYNAGPGRPIRWIARNGDPRDAEVDAVDWIEHIPFRETQNYVMRVMESLPVYRARLTGEVAEIRLSEELKVR